MNNGIYYFGDMFVNAVSKLSSTFDVANYYNKDILLVEKNVSDACNLLRFSLDAALNSKKKTKKIYNTNAAVHLMPAAYKPLYAAVFVSLQHISTYMLRFI